MKPFFATMFSVLRDKRTIALIALCVCVLGVFFYTTSKSTAELKRQYAAYAVLAKSQEDATYVPGAPNNPVRQQLDQLLARVLTPRESPAERLQLANQGLSALQDSKKQIDAITEAGDKADAALAKMQVDMLNDFSSSQSVRELVALAKQRSSTISDIRAYSYRANFEIDRIFHRVIDDKGKLTDDFVANLNNEIPDVEQQFNKRSNLYVELQTTSQKIDDKAALLGSFWQR